MTAAAAPPAKRPEMRPPRIGRPKGVPNKRTAELKALASQYTEPCVRGLVEIAFQKRRKGKKGIDPLGYVYEADMRTRAIGLLLDRAHGKPPQMVRHSGGLTSLVFNIGGPAVTATIEPPTIENDEGEE